MSAFLNRVQLVGNLGLDPERRHFQSSGSVVTLRVATTEKYRDARGEVVERTEWHSVAVWPDGLQDLVTQYLRKGAKVMVEGKLRTRKWQDESGADRYSTEIHVTPYDGKILFLDGPARRERDEAAADAHAEGGATGAGQGAGRPAARAPRGRATAGADAAAAADGSPPAPDDDIPF